MRLKRNKDGSFTLTLASADALFLRKLCDDLRALFAKPDYKQPAMKKLFPRLAEDSKTDAELRQLLQDEHRKQKLERAEAFAALLEDLPAAGGALHLSALQMEHLLTVINDLRFVHADAIGIESDNWRPSRKLDPDDPQTQIIFTYEYLTALQQLLIDRCFDDLD
jgi:hypothetical protein